MRVIGLDGRQHTISLGGRGGTRPRSAPHLRARALLGTLFPLTPLLEEVSLPGSGGLAVDFFLPQERVIVEVQGIQHFRYTPHFHQTRAGFLASLKRDADKAEWCELNGIRLVTLADTEDDDEWRLKITGRRGGGETEGGG